MTEQVMIWSVQDDPERREFDTREAAVARAWELTPPGGKRSDPVMTMRFVLGDWVRKLLDDGMTREQLTEMERATRELKRRTREAATRA